MTERQEASNLFYRKTKLSRRTVVPSLSDVIDDSFATNPLRAFRMDKARTRQVYDLANASASNLSEVVVADRDETDTRYRPPESYYLHAAKEYGDAIPTAGLHVAWENGIVDLVPKHLRLKYSRVVAQILQETRENYREDMHRLGVETLTVLRSPEPRLVHDVLLGQNGRTRNYGKFLRNRKSIRNRYYLCHKLIRSIRAKARSNLPEKFLNLSRYRELGLLDLNQLREAIAVELRTSSTIVVTRYYEEVSRSTVKYVATDEVCEEFLNCATGFFVREILTRIIATIDDATEILNDGRQCPRLKLELICTGNEIGVRPGIDEIYQTYHGVVDDVATMLPEMTPFEYSLKLKTEKNYLRVELPEWMRREAHEKLQLVLERVFQPLNSHRARIKSRFDLVCKTTTRSEVAEFVAGGGGGGGGSNFAECCVLVDKFRGFIEGANELVANEYYAVGRLSQTNAAASLKRRATDIVDIVVERLVNYHVEYNRSICDAFDDVAARASADIPSNAKDLFDLSEYMAWASTHLVDDLKERIRVSIGMLDSLTSIADLTAAHMDLNRQTINWLSEIETIFERSAVLCEAMKCDLEDELQRRINAANAEVDEFIPKLVVLDDMDDAQRIREYVGDLDVLARRLDTIDEQIRWINLEERLFKFPETVFPKVVEIKEVVGPFNSLVRLIYRWKRDIGVWLDGPFEYLDATAIREKTGEYQDRFSAIGKNYRARMKTDLATNKSYKFSGIVDDPDPMQQPAPLKLCWQALGEANDFAAWVPLAVCVCNPALVKRHWDEMSAIAGVDLVPNAGTTLRKIIGLDLMRDIEKYEAISIGANKELALRHQLDAMTSQWDSILFRVDAAGSDPALLIPPEDVEILLEEQIVRLEEMRGSYFVRPIEREVAEFRTTLRRIGETIERWIVLQVRWSELRSVFEGRGTEKELPKESALFGSVTDILRNAATRIAVDPRVRRVTGEQSFLNSIQRAADDMEKIREGVRRYVTSKRLRFPRFFFLSDKEVLSTLFGDSRASGRRLTKFFRGVSGLRVDSAGYYCLFGHDGERVRVGKRIVFEADSSRVEDWLIQVERDMIEALKRDARVCHSRYDEIENYEEKMFRWPGMVSLCVSQIYWTTRIGVALRDGLISRPDLTSRVDERLLRAFGILRSAISRRKRFAISASIISDLHVRDVATMLSQSRAEEERDFNWQAQLRHYLESEGGEVDEEEEEEETDEEKKKQEDRRTIRLRMLSLTFAYGYEYTGNEAACAVAVTPLTERCYRSLIEALGQNLYGALEGPTASGKSETVKSLARALGVPCVVVGCTSDLDYTCMGNMLKGVVSCGAWLCLDDFDRMSPEVLSVVGQQIRAISQAAGSKLERFDFEGTNLKLEPRHNICVTLYPGQRGRNVVPDNTRLLFRTVAMVMPDVLKICEVKLYAACFAGARSLALKLETTHKLCADSLSSESRYDYGMRSTRTVLRTAARLKLRYPTEDESVLLLRSLVDVHLAKFSERDVGVFQGILRDLFPDVALPPPNYRPVLEALRRICRSRNLQCHESFELKALQLLEMTRSRRGTMIMGEPMGGKTTILRCLAAVLRSRRGNNDFGSVRDVRTVNPRVLPADRLFGTLTGKSREWRDGVASVVLREFQESTDPGTGWLILDGPLDHANVETLNTVLDESCGALCLASGERILASGGTKIIFETRELSGVSPATVSRCGIIYVEPRSIGWKPFADSWLETSAITGHPPIRKLVGALVRWLIEPCLRFVASACREAVPVNEISRVVTTLNLVEMFLSDAVADDKYPPEHASPWTQAATMQAVAWGIGGNLEYDSSHGFDEFFASLWSGTVDRHPVPEAAGILDVPLPAEGSIRDHYYTFKGRGTWKHWNDALKSEKISDTDAFGTSVHGIVVPTVDGLRYSNLLGRHLDHRRQFLVSGDTGTGKTLCVGHLLRHGPRASRYLSNTFTFAGSTTAAAAQRAILGRLTKKSRGRYGPPENKLCVNFVDDVNMPVVAELGSPPPLELLRQLFDHGYWYDLGDDPEEVVVDDVMFVAAMTLSRRGGERPPCPRFLRHFHVFAIPKHSRENIFRIFSNVCLHGLKKNGFNADVLPVVNGLVNATLEVYAAVTSGLKATPTRPHYTYDDSRDVGRSVAGLVLVRKDAIESKLSFVRLWIHEMLRVFGDRLAEARDSRWLVERIKDSCGIFFKDSFDSALDHLPRDNDGEITEESLRSLIFGNFMDDGSRGYEEIRDTDALRRRAERYLDDYNASHSKRMNLVLFRRALEHLARLCRILAIPGENLIFVAADGCGRRSLTRLASHATRHRVREPAAGTSTDPSAWRDNLRAAFRESAGSDDRYVFLIVDGQTGDEHLRDVDSLLNTGEVPNLFTIEERQEIVETTRLAAQGGDRNLEISSVAVMEYYARRCRERHHLVLCFAPTGRRLRRVLSRYPSLRDCSVNWLEDWPATALEEVAARFIDDARLVEPDVRARCARACLYVHATAAEIARSYRENVGRHVHVTIPAFLHLVRSFAELASRKRDEITAARNRYVAGLEKLRFAAGQVARMKTTLTALRPQLELSARQTVATMEEIENENVSVERATVLVTREEAIANRKAEIAGTLKTECEADLAVAIPILEDAIAALNTLKPADITLVKAMKNPPDTVKLVMAAVCVMLNVPPERTMDPATGKKTTDYWGPSKRVLGDMNFLQNLKDYDKDNIPVALMNVVKKTYMTDKSFMPDIVAKASSAAEGLCKWVRAMVSYDDVAKVVAPKKEKLVAAQRECDETEAFLNEKRKTLADLNAKLAVLNGSLRATLAKKMDLEQQVASCTDKLVKAENLIGSLGGEKRRWMRSAERLERFYENVAGDVLVSCGVVAYLGPFSTARRREAVGTWQRRVRDTGIAISDEYSFVDVLGSEIKISSWKIYGLSKDTHATENAVIMDNTGMWSLLVDPENRASEWIREMERPNGLRVVKLADARRMEIIEHGIETGRPVLLENIDREGLEGPLDAILLSRDVYETSNGVRSIDVHGKTLRLAEGFRFYATTRLPNPRLPPYAFNLASVVDFSMTDESLVDHLLDIVVAKESPDLQEKIDDLLVQSAANKRGLKQEEENILATLSTSTTNILEDDNAIKLLDSSRHLAVSIAMKQEASSAAESQIDEFRRRYRPFAAHVASSYRTLAGLPYVNPVYEFSLEWFVRLYVRSIETSNRSSILQKRLDYLRNAFTSNLHESVSRSLFEDDKLLYSMILYARMMLDAGSLNPEEIEFLLSENRETENNDGRESTTEEQTNPGPDWLSEAKWREIRRACAVLPSFGDRFEVSFRRNASTWKRYCESENPEDPAVVPSPWSGCSLTEFQQLIVVRALRPDMLIRRITRLVTEGMGARFSSSASFDAEKSYGESNCLVPLVFLLSPGFDPRKPLERLARKLGFAARLSTQSLGQGQGNVARTMIKRAQRRGSWIFLENCHLAGSWSSVLERICEGLDASNTSLDFRLWLSTRPTSSNLPVSILRRAVKMTNEPAKSLKRNLTRRYNVEPIADRDFFDGCPGKEETFAKLLYGLSLFHAVVQNRGSFGPRGWSAGPYRFDDADFHASAKRLRALVNAYDAIPLEATADLIVDCNYGGKVWDEEDRRCLLAHFKQFCHLGAHRDAAFPRIVATIADALPVFSEKSEYRYYLDRITGIPEDPSPEIFGLDGNADVARRTSEASRFLGAMLLARGYPANSTIRLPTGERPGRRVVEEWRENLPPPIDLDEDPEISDRTPLDIFLRREAAAYNRILRDVRGSLDLLVAAREGLAEWTPSLEALSLELDSGRVPDSWQRGSSAANSVTDLPVFLRDISRGVDLLRDSLARETPSAFRISAIVTSGPAFLAAVRQTHARRHGVPFRNVAFDFTVLPTRDHRRLPKPAQGVYVYGLFLTGARWDADRMILAESLPGIVSEPMPVLYYHSAIPSPRTVATYACPIYRAIVVDRRTYDSLNRPTDYVAVARLATDEPVERWIKRRTLLSYYPVDQPRVQTPFQSC